jgi:hypothetical protein
MKLLCYIVLLCIATGCSKNRSNPDDRSAPTIIKISPADNQSFPAGQPVNINMQIDDENKLFVVHVHISDNNTGQILYDIHRYPDSGHYDLAESFIAKAGIAYKVQVIARDTGGNETVLSFSVSGS